MTDQEAKQMMNFIAQVINGGIAPRFGPGTQFCMVVTHPDSPSSRLIVGTDLNAAMQAIQATINNTNKALN